MLTLIPNLPSNVVGVEAYSKVTSEDYKRVIVSAVDAAHAASPEGKVRVLFVIHYFPDYTAGAIWEDTFALGRFTSWERIAVVCDADWLGTSLRAFCWMMPGEVRAFALDGLDDARAWIAAGD